MIQVKMTEAEFKAYLLFLKSIEVMQEDQPNEDSGLSLDQYLADAET